MRFMHDFPLADALGRRVTVNKPLAPALSKGDG